MPHPNITGEAQHPLPKPPFTDRERAAFDWLQGKRFRCPWSVDAATKVVSGFLVGTDLITIAQHHGWEG